MYENKYRDEEEEPQNRPASPPLQLWKEWGRTDKGKGRADDDIKEENNTSGSTASNWSRLRVPVGNSYEEEDEFASRYTPFGGTGTYNPIRTSTPRTEPFGNDDDEFQDELDEMQQSFNQGKRQTRRIRIRRNLSS